MRREGLVGLGCPSRVVDMPRVNSQGIPEPQWKRRIDDIIIGFLSLGIRIATGESGA
jgi:hypothetical protein